MRRAKYGNIRTAGSDSKAESRRIAALKLREQAGEISELRTQVKFELIPAQYIGGKCVERAVTYRADAVYKEDGRLVVEDVKSPVTITPQYVIKRKLMLWVHGIQIVEVM